MSEITFNGSSNVLVHHGIKGQRWGVRRFQNEDGSLTAAGKKKQGSKATSNSEKEKKKLTPEQKKKITKIAAISSGALLGTAAVTTASVIGGKFVAKQAGQVLEKKMIEFALTGGGAVPKWWSD